MILKIMSYNAYDKYTQILSCTWRKEIFGIRKQR